MLFPYRQKGLGRVIVDGLWLGPETGGLALKKARTGLIAYGNPVLPGKAGQKYDTCQVTHVQRCVHNDDIRPLVPSIKQNINTNDC
jgi:hypothetical protein